MINAYKVVDGFSFNEKTEENVIKEILKAYNGKYRIRIWYGDEKKSWNEDFDIIGTIGRSIGVNKIPLLIKSSRSYGGCGILDSCIVRIDVNYGDCKKTRYIKDGVYFPTFYTLYDGEILKVYYDDIDGKRTLYGFNKTEKSTRNLCKFMNGFSWKKY